MNGERPQEPRSTRRGIAHGASRIGQLAGAVAALGLAILGLGCGMGESAAQRVTRVRRQYDVWPVGVMARPDGEGREELVVEALVRNRGSESLTRLTCVVHVAAADGVARVARPVSLDVSGLSPGVAARVSAPVPGVGPTHRDWVLLEVEDEPDAVGRADYAEYGAESGADLPSAGVSWPG